MIKNFVKWFGIIALVAVIGFSLVACGGGDSPQSLAKQTYQVFGKAMAKQGTEASDLAFVLWSMSEPQELKAIAAKVEALSASDQEAYEAELGKILEGK